MANKKHPDKHTRQDGEAPSGPARDERSWSEKIREIIKTATRLARFADDLARVWHDWTGGGPGWPTRR